MITKFIEYNKKQRYMYTARFNKHAVTGGVRGIKDYLIFIDLRKEGKYISQYVLFNNIKTFNDLHLKEGEVVRFYARDIDFIVNNCPSYTYGDSRDICSRLLNPTKATKLVEHVHRINNNTEKQKEPQFNIKVNYGNHY